MSSNLLPFTYTVVRYVHDAAAGETLNVGVIAYAPTIPALEVRIENRYERLSSTFSRFNGEQYRRTLQRLAFDIRQLTKEWERTPLLPSLPKDLGAIVSELWPDAGLSFSTGPVLAGVTDDFSLEVSLLFERMITSQYDRPSEGANRTDDQVWRVFQQSLRGRAVRALQPRTFRTPDAEYEFDYAFKNGSWQIVQPLSFDFMRSETLQNKATRWLGTTVALRDVADLSKIYFLLGRPQIAAHATAYVKAKNLLHKSPIPHEIIDEDEASRFAEEFESYLRQQGVLESDGE